MQKLQLELKNVPTNAPQVCSTTSSVLNKPQRVSVQDKVLDCNKVIKKQSFKDKGKKRSVQTIENMRRAALKCHRENPEKRKKQSETLKESYVSGKTTPIVHTEKTKMEISKKLKGVYIGDKNSMYGKKHTRITKQKMSNNTSGKNNGMFGKRHRQETKKNMRISRISYIEKCLNEGNPIHPNTGKNEKQILDNIEIKQGIKIERQFSVLGYWCDGFCKGNNTIYEIDEKRHFDINGGLSKKDLERQQNITEFLNCNFVRIKDI